MTPFAGADDPGPVWAVVTPPAPARRLVDEAGRVRLRGHRTIDLRGGLDPIALEPICSAMSGS